MKAFLLSQYSAVATVCKKMKLIVLLATIVLVSAKSIKIDQLEYGFCGELEIKYFLIKYKNISKLNI